MIALIITSESLLKITKASDRPLSVKYKKNPSIIFALNRFSVYKTMFVRLENVYSGQ
jgi:hypothetical protein